MYWLIVLVTSLFIGASVFVVALKAGINRALSDTDAPGDLASYDGTQDPPEQLIS